MMRIPAALWSAALTMMSSISIAATLEASGPEEVVFEWRSQRCEQSHFPDAPARAVRTPDGRVLLVAAHHSNIPLVGQTFDDLQPQCQISSRGGRDPDPSKFNDVYWIQGLAILPKSERIFVLLSHDYNGVRHPGRCDTKPNAAARCWFNTIFAATANPDLSDLQRLDDPVAKVGEPSESYRIGAKGRTGFFTTSNIVHQGGFSYFFSYREIDGSPANCLFRARSDNLVGSWEVLGSAGFTQDRSACRPIRTGFATSPLRSVVWLSPASHWAVFFKATRRSKAEAEDSIYYALSSDLINWSEPKQLVSIPHTTSTDRCKTWFEYPSALDHYSSSPNFDTVGATFWLYMTRFNWEGCRQADNRDLVRIPITVR